MYDRFADVTIALMEDQKAIRGFSAQVWLVDSKPNQIRMGDLAHFLLINKNAERRAWIVTEYTLVR